MSDFSSLSHFSHVHDVFFYKGRCFYITLSVFYTNVSSGYYFLNTTVLFLDPLK